MKKKTPHRNVEGESPCAAVISKVHEIASLWQTELESLYKSVVVNSKPELTEIDPFVVVRVLQRLHSDPPMLMAIGEALIRDSVAWAESQILKVVTSFDADLRKRASEHKVEVSGRFPSYLVESFLEVAVLIDEGICEIGSRRVDTLMMSKAWELIVAAVDAERNRLMPPQMFLHTCYNAYRRASLLGGLPHGQPVAIKKVFREFVIELQSDKFWRCPDRAKLVEYSSELFARDLGRLMKVGVFVRQDGTQLELHPTAFAKDGFPVQSDGGIRYFGSVAFRERSYWKNCHAIKREEFSYI